MTDTTLTTIDVAARAGDAGPAGTETHAETPGAATPADAVATRPGTRHRGARRRRLRFGRVLRSEWIKFWTLRSTPITLLSTFLLIVGFGLVAAAVSSGQVDSSSTPGGAPGLDGADPMTIVLAGADFAVLIVGVLGALAGSREFSTGMIRTTLAAVPRRLPVLWSRAVTLVVAVFPVALAGVLVAFAAGNEILAAGGSSSLGWSDDGVVRALVGQAAYITAVAVLGLSLGIVLRSTAASIGTLVAGLLFLPNLGALLLPDSWESALQYLPSNAGSALSAVVESDALLSASDGGLVLLGWVVASLTAAALALRTRDA